MFGCQFISVLPYSLTVRRHFILFLTLFSSFCLQFYVFPLNIYLPLILFHILSLHDCIEYLTYLF